MRKIYPALLAVLLFLSCTNRVPEAIELPVPDFSLTVLDLIDSYGEDPEQFQFEEPYDDYGVIVYSTNVADYDCSIRYFYSYNINLDLFEMDTADYSLDPGEKNWKDCVKDFEGFRLYGDENFESVTNYDTADHIYSDWKAIEPHSGQWLILSLDLRNNHSGNILFWYTVSVMADNQEDSL